MKAFAAFRKRVLVEGTRIWPLCGQMGVWRLGSWRRNILAPNKSIGTSARALTPKLKTSPRTPQWRWGRRLLPRSSFFPASRLHPWRITPCLIGTLPGDARLHLPAW